jgi:hypothetical protein
MRPKAAHSMMHSGRSAHAAKASQGGKRRQVGMTIGHHTHLGAGRPLEHPGWNLKPTVGIGTAQITAKNNSVRLLDSFVNADPKSKPRVPWVQQFPKLSSVGVPKPCCTTPTDRTRASTGSHQPSSQHAPTRGKTGTDSPYERGQGHSPYNSLRNLTFKAYSIRLLFTIYCGEVKHRLFAFNPFPRNPKCSSRGYPKLTLS